MQKHKKICLIELGGTISCVTNDPLAEFYHSPGEQASDIAGDLGLDHIEIIHKSLFRKISQNLIIEDLLLFANTIQSLLEVDEIDGVVVTIGTNAIEDIAYFIGLVIKTQKPIVFTGSHYPQGSLCFDGKLNLFNALTVAAAEDAKKLGVLITFNGAVVSAHGACKSSPGFMDNFVLGERSSYVGEVIGGYFKLRSVPAYRHTYRSEFDLKNILQLAKTCIIYAHIGMDEFMVRSAITAGVSGIISAGFGKGYQDQKITEELHIAVKSGVVVVRCPRFGTSYCGIDKGYDDKYLFVVSRGLSPHKSSLLLSVASLFTKDRDDLMRIFEEY